MAVYHATHNAKYRFNCSNKRNSWLTITINLLVGKKWRRHHSSREQRHKFLANQPSIDGICICMHGDDSQVWDERMEDCIVQRCKVQCKSTLQLRWTIQSSMCSFQLMLRKSITYDSQVWKSFSGVCVANPNIYIDPPNTRKWSLRLRAPQKQNGEFFFKNSYKTFPHVWEEDAVCVFRW